MDEYQENNNQYEGNVFDSSHDRDHYTKNKAENKFTKRAKSFKDDIIGIISSIRTTSRSPCRTPKSHEIKTDVMKTADERDLSFCFKQVTNSLRHFLNVISMNTLEMLPGNGTIVLETVYLVHSAVTSHDLNCQSSRVHSTLNQVYQSVANLIKFCDDYFLSNNNEEEINEEQAKEFVAQVEEAVRNLVDLVNKDVITEGSKFRASLPDINMITETDTSVSDSSEVLENSHCLNKSWESISMANAPSKPPIERHYTDYPPPLPPKKRNFNVESLERLSGSSSQGEYDLHSLQDDSNFQHSFVDGTQSPHLRTQSAQYFSISSSSQHMMSSSHHHVNVNQLSSKWSVSSSSAVSVSPPPLPDKQHIRRQRHDSHYDNVPELLANLLPSSEDIDDTPPPLPPKKKHIMAYMEMFGHCHAANMSCLADTHSSCTCSLFTRSYYSQGIESLVNVNEFHHRSTLNKWIHDASQSSLNSSPSHEVQEDSKPPALPPKRHNPSPNKHNNSYSNDNLLQHKFPGDLKQETLPPPPTPENSCPIVEDTEPASSTSDSLDECRVNFIHEFDVREHLIFTEEQTDIRGGHPEALLVHATRDNNEHHYQDAFLTTFRTFKTPLEIIKKLIHRYNKFQSSSEVPNQRAARESFSFLVRVVAELTMCEIEDDLVQFLTSFIYQMISSGHFKPAKTLRNKLIEKHGCKNKDFLRNELLPSLNVYTRQYTLLDFKSEHIAEQMTLLDSELFVKIEIPEVLAWIEQQNEEKSPNLTRFTEHFNKVSYWARTRILEQNEARDREKYVVKFIKIMKHLRKMNNFNSYLGLLSALDSAPIRRLEWQKHITEGLKEYCALIDSTSSFRAYRQALAETVPPCIPYIGLVLQDLTFVHIGNPHLLPVNELPGHIQYKNVINFSKRRQQFNIVQNMRRFRNEVHQFPRHDRIIEFFSNFDDFLSEEAMWQMSETIKPRGKPKH